MRAALPDLPCSVSAGLEAKRGWDTSIYNLGAWKQGCIKWDVWPWPKGMGQHWQPASLIFMMVLAVYITVASSGEKKGVCFKYLAAEMQKKLISSYGFSFCPGDEATQRFCSKHILLPPSSRRLLCKPAWSGLARRILCWWLAWWW